MILKINLEDIGVNEEGSSVKTDIEFSMKDINKEFDIKPPV